VRRSFSGKLIKGVAVNNVSEKSFIQNESTPAHKRSNNFDAGTSNDSSKCKIAHSTSSSFHDKIKTPFTYNKNGSIKENKSKNSLKLKIDNYETVVVAVVNCRSLKNKIPEFHHLINSTGAKVIIGTESWLTDDISNSEIFPDSFRVYRKDRPNRHGGGVFIAIDKAISSQAVSVPESNLESVWCSISCPKSKQIFVCAFYRPPNTNPNPILELDSQIKCVTSKNSTRNIIIGGDFNTPSINWINYSHVPGGRDKDTCESLLQLFASYNLHQMVTKPNRGDNILDLLATNIPEQVINVNTVEGISDHSVVTANLCLNINKSIKQRRKIYLFKKADFNAFKTHLNTSLPKFQESSVNLDTEDTWANFLSIISSGIEQFIPNNFKKENSDPRWYNVDVRRALRRQRACHSKMKNLPTDTPDARRNQILEKYKTSKATTREAFRSAFIEFKRKTLLEQLKHNPKAFWSFVRETQGTRSTVNPLRNTNGEIVTTSLDKANLLNFYFQSVFTNSPQTTHIEIKPRSKVTMPPIHISSDGIENLLKELNPNKSPGPEGIPARVFRDLAPEIAPYLQIVFNKSVSEHTVPRVWRVANVTPIFKNGDKEQPSNYRPISLTSIACKFLEHIIVSSIMKHLDSQDLLNKFQHGFRKGRSCETQLALFTHDILLSGDGNTPVDAIFIDFKKAFDKVPHSKLLLKLKSYGIDNNVISWIREFLSDRVQRVVLDGITSSEVKVSSGVPQGSVIGPLLFLLYINDISEIVKSKIRLFADDAVVYREIRDNNDIEALSNDLEAIEKWCDTWQLELNLKKCVVLNFWRKNTSQQHRYSIQNTILESVDTVKYLGITLTHNLSWSRHIQDITGQANRKLGFVKRVLGKCDEKVREISYFSLVRPHLEYASSIWDPHEVGLITELERVQRRSARYVKGRYDNLASVTSLLQNLGWQSLMDRRSNFRISLLDKFQSNIFSDDVKDILRHPTYYARFDHKDKIREIDCRTDRFKMSFFPRTIRESNNCR
jgi:hypothetical protein